MDLEAPNTKPAAAQASTRSLVSPFNRAGMPSVADLGFDAESNSPEDDTIEQGMDLVGFPGERVPHVSFGFEGERWRIRNIAWILAQSPLGLTLLESTYVAGFRICFDAMACGGDQLDSLLNLADKVICLDPRASTEQLTLMLASQLAVATDVSHGVPFDLRLHPAAAVLTNRLLTASSLAAALQVTWELKDVTTLPAQANREAFWARAQLEYPAMAAAFSDSASNALAVEGGLAAAAAIRFFYTLAPQRMRADEEILNVYRALPTHILKDAKAMQTGFDAANLPFKFKTPGVGYATSHEPKLNLSDSANSGVFPETAEVLTLLQTARRNAGVKDRDSWVLPVVQM